MKKTIIIAWLWIAGILGMTLVPSATAAIFTGGAGDGECVATMTTDRSLVYAGTVIVVE